MPRWARGESGGGAGRSLPGPFRQAYLDVKGEQSLEQLGLAIKMMLAEPAARYLFPAVLKKHRRLRNGAKPGQFLGGLPVIGANRKRPKHDPGLRPWPRSTQPASEVAQVHV